jgi:hypothetical protein
MHTNILSRNSLLKSRGAQTWVATLGCLLALVWLLVQGRVNLLTVLFALTVLVAASVVSKPLCICFTLGYLFLLGDIRRVVAMLGGYPTLDPLLLVGPAISMLLALPILLRLRLKDPISKAMLALMAVMGLEVANPRQGPIVVGLAGAMFFIVPTFWFWIGREYGTDKLLETVIYKIVIPIAVLDALLGACQTFVGFFPWELAWIHNSIANSSSLSLGGNFYRAFGFSVNVAEYDELLLVASTCVAAAFFSGRRFYGLLFPGLAVMLFLASSRGSIVRCLFAVAAAWALSSRGGRGWMMRLPFAIALGVGLLALVLSQISSGNSNSGTTSAVSASLQHQSQGLEHPLDNHQSTAGLHASMVVGGFKKGFLNPIGRGIGAVTLGSSRLGGDESAAGSTEVDISDAFVSMGIVGGLLYLYIVWIVLGQAVTFGRTAPKFLGLPALGILAALFGSWMAVGQYALTPLVWFVIGVLSRHGVRKASRPIIVDGVASTKASPLAGMTVPTLGSHGPVYPR